MNKTEAKQFVAALASHPSQRAAALAMGTVQSNISARLTKARAVLGDEQVDQIFGRHGKVTPVASRASGTNVRRTAVSHRTTKAALAEAVIDGNVDGIRAARLEEENNKLRKQAKTLAEQALTDEQVRNNIMQIAHHKPQVPTWLKVPKRGESWETGVPILFGSDWHWGEVVKASEIGGVNSYNLEIAHERLHTLVETTISLLKDHMVRPDYPGIIFALGGDMVSGNIHDELCETNDLPIMPVVLDLIDHLTAAIKRFKDEFGRVFLPCVAGNHGRLHRKPRAKESNFNSYDWLIYQALDRNFKDDPDVVFYIPDGPDALVSVAGHKYLFTHGNQFRGGDGMIGPLGPVTRGDHKKRSRNAQIEQDYDTLVIGHFHTLLQTNRVIMNGSLIGYNEYAHSNNFGYEPPKQALWITHPENGITFSMPVHVGKDVKKKSADQPWVTFFEAHKAKEVQR